MTSTATKCWSATAKPAAVGSIASHPVKLSVAIPSTTGTKTALTRSASAAIGAFDPCASSTARTMPASAVSAAPRVTRTVSAPVWFNVPA